MSETKVRPFRVKKPCPRCPFRTDVPKYIYPERAQEIADSLYGGAEFPCHQTTSPSDDDVEMVVTKDSAWCAGAMGTMEKEGYSNQMVRIGERLGMVEEIKVDDDLLYDSLADWVQSFREIPTVTITNSDGSTEVLEYEHCGVVYDNDCEDPPGYSAGGGVAQSTDEPTCHPIDDCCAHCGSLMCTACRAAETTEDGYPQCKGCVEDGEG